MNASSPAVTRTQQPTAKRRTRWLFLITVFALGSLVIAALSFKTLVLDWRRPVTSGKGSGWDVSASQAAVLQPVRPLQKRARAFFAEPPPATREPLIVPAIQTEPQLDSFLNAVIRRAGAGPHADPDDLEHALESINSLTEKIGLQAAEQKHTEFLSEYRKSTEQWASRWTEPLSADQLVNKLGQTTNALERREYRVRYIELVKRMPFAEQMAELPRLYQSLGL